MSRILFEPKRRLLARITLAFALVLILQSFLSVYLVLNAMDRTIQTGIDADLIRVGSIAVTESLLPRALEVQPNDKRAPIILSALSESLSQLVSISGVRRAHLFRIDGLIFTYLAGTVEEGEPVPKPKLTNVQLQQMATGQTVTIQPFRDKNGFLLKSAYFPILKGEVLKGVVIVDDDATDLEVMSFLRRQLYGITAIGFILAVMASFFLARTIVRPIRRLVDVAEDMGAGNYKARFPIRGHDEINFLAQTINDMAEDIQARDEQIRQMNQAALADARQLYEHVLRAMVSGIITVDIAGYVTSENPAAVQMLSLAENEGQMITERLIAHPALLEIWARGEPVRNKEVQISSPTGEMILEVTMQPLTDHRNEVIGQSLSLVDRTETKRLEHELVMRERLAALGELAAGIAHEIRNPLNGIELMLGLVQEDLTEKGVVDERFIGIHNEVARLNVILTDFLLFARPKPLEKDPYNLIEVVEDALMLTAADLEEKQIAVQRQYDAYIPDAMLDHAAMRRAIVNLIKNACQAMYNGGNLEMTLRGPSSTSDGFFISICDSGPGIPPEVIDRIFHPFVTSKAEGTGLGLSIVHKTIVNHKGTIRCYNQKQGGACFEITLPYVEVS